MKHVNVILFDAFETLDAFGPVEIIGRMLDEFICIQSLIRICKQKNLTPLNTYVTLPQ